MIVATKGVRDAELAMEDGSGEDGVTLCGFIDDCDEVDSNNEDVLCVFGTVGVGDDGSRDSDGICC